VRVAAQEPVNTRGIEGRGGEDAAQQDAEEPAHAVDAPHVERIVPAHAVLQGHGVEAHDAGDEADQAGRARRDVTRRGRDRGQARDGAEFGQVEVLDPIVRLDLDRT
jgi:hypothetical protein